MTIEPAASRFAAACVTTGSYLPNAIGFAEIVQLLLTVADTGIDAVAVAAESPAVVRWAAPAIASEAASALRYVCLFMICSLEVDGCENGVGVDACAHVLAAEDPTVYGQIARGHRDGGTQSEE